MYYAQQNKSVRERQIPCDFSRTWNLRNESDEHMGRGETGGGGKQTVRNLRIENKLQVDEGSWEGDGLNR